MMAAALLLIVGLITFFGVLFFAASPRAPRPAVQKRTLREIESTLLEIQNYSDDIYAKGRATTAVEQVRELLDRD